MRHVFESIYDFTKRHGWDLTYVYREVKRSMPVMALIFDECHVMLQDCTQDFRSIRDADMTFAQGRISNARTLFTFFADRILSLK